MSRPFSAALVAPILLAVWAAPAAAQADSVYGRVADTSGAAIGRARVTLEELGRSAETDTTGAFVFRRVRPGEYTLVVRRLNFEPTVRRIAVPLDAALAVSLRASAFTLEAVTVTATREPLPVLRSPLPPASVPADRLRRYGDVSLAQALGELPGVRTLSTGGEIGKPVIRGLSGARVLALDDGLRLEDYSWSDEDGPSADPELAQRIEVIRGPASLLYGSDAMGGVVNVLAPEVPDARGGTLPVHGRADLFGATNNAEVGAVVSASGGNGGVGWRAATALRRSEALHTPVGELDNTGFWSANGDAAAGISGAWGRATLRFIHYGGDFHLLEADSSLNPPPSGEEDQGPVRRLNDDRLQLLAQIPAGAVRLEAKAQWQRHRLAEIVPPDTASGDEGFDLLLTTGTLDLLAHHGAGPLTGTVGLSGLVQENATRGTEPLVPGASTTGGAVFAVEELTAGPWSVLGGARIDARTVSADANAGLALPAVHRDFSAWSGDVGLVRRFGGDVALAANVGRAWRAPTLFELFTNGPNVGDARFVVGDSGLVPEGGLDADLSLRWEGERVRGEIAVYSNRIDHYIYLNPTGATQDSLPVYAYVQANAVLTGGEAGVELEAAPGVTLSARGDWVRAARTDGTPLPLTPAPRLVVGGEWRRSAPVEGQGLALRAAVEMVAHQSRLAPTDLPTAGYALLHLGGDLGFRVGGRPLQLGVEARNVLNKRYRDFLSRYKAFALNPGRNVVIRCSTVF